MPNFVQLENNIIKMADNSDFIDLVGNLHKGLKKFSVKEMNNQLSQIIKDKDESDIKKALNLVCKEFNVPYQTLMQKNQRGELHDAKDIAYCLLHFDLNLKVRYIAKEIFDNWPNSVSKGVNRLKKINVKVKQDEIFFCRYSKLRDELIVTLQKIN